MLPTSSVPTSIVGNGNGNGGIMEIGELNIRGREQLNSLICDYLSFHGFHVSIQYFYITYHIIPLYHRHLIIIMVPMYMYNRVQYMRFKVSKRRRRMVIAVLLVALHQLNEMLLLVDQHHHLYHQHH